MKSISVLTLAAVAATLAPTATVVALVPPSTMLTRSQSISDAMVSFPPTKLGMADDDDSWGGPSKSAMIGGAGINNAGEPPFEIRGFSLGNVVIAAGLLITVLSFVEYLSDSGSEGLNVSGLGFVYGIPVFLAGAALKYAEIDPVPVFSTPAG